MVWLGKDDMNPQFGRYHSHQSVQSCALPAWQVALEKVRQAGLNLTEPYTWPGQTRCWCEWPRMPKGCDPSSGGLSVVRAWRKRRQLENLMGPLEFLLPLSIGARELRQSDCYAEKLLRVVDFCAGSGQVGLAVAGAFLGRANLAEYELRVDIIDTCIPKIEKLCMERLRRASAAVRRCCNARVEAVEDYPEAFDIGIALHACGIATDSVLDRCIAARAAFILAPCCVGRLAQPSAFRQRPRSQLLQTILSPEEMRSIARSGDCTVRDPSLLTADDALRRQCKAVVDADRLSVAAEAGYITARFTMSPFGCTPKNDVLFGWPSEWGDGGAADHRWPPIERLC